MTAAREDVAAPPVLRVREARKAFGTVRALDGATLELRPGELLALLGPNGAGKTTLIRAISGRVRLDQGEIELFGRPLDGAAGRTSLAVVPQEIALYPLLSARENLRVFGSLYGVPASRLAERVAWALDWTGLAERAGGLVRGFSGGMKRRLNVACGVLHEPRALLLDEPTVGVDPQSRERLYDMLAELRGRGTSLLLTTHQLEEAEARCERIVIIDHGRVVAAGTLAELVERTIGGGRQIVIRLDREPARPLPGLEAGEGGTLRGTVSDAGRDLPELIARVQQAGCRIEHLEVRPA